MLVDQDRIAADTPTLRELTVRYTVKTDGQGQPISLGPVFRNPTEGAALLAGLLEDEAVEVFAMLCLTTQHHIIAYHEVSRGTLDGALVHPREVFKAALLANAATVVLTHNHPSGDPTPSGEDRHMTRCIANAGLLLAIPVLDHIIIGDRRYFSFRAAGLL